MALLDFDTIFKKKESQVLFGKNNISLIFLSAILFITFLALGHVFGGREELRERMNDPFTNWINIPVNSSEEKVVNRMIDDFEEKGIADSFNIESIDPYQIYWFKSFDSELKRTRNYRVRSINVSDPILKNLLDEENTVVKSKTPFSECAIIVTEAVMNNLGHPFGEEDQIQLPILDNEYADEKAIMIFSVSAVVKELPDNVDIAITDELMSLLNADVQKTGFIDQRDKNECSFFSKEQKEEAWIAEELLPDSVLMGTLNHIPVQINGEDYVEHSFKISTSYPFYSWLRLQSNWYEKGCYTQLPFNCNSQVNNRLIAFYYAFNFSGLSKVKPFRDYIKEKYNIEVSLDQVESRNNFYLMSRLANLFIYLLVFFSCGSILLFLQNIVKNHLEKIKANLGTLKAFGLSDKRIRKLYIQIILRFFCYASLVAFVCLLLYNGIIQTAGWKVYFDLLNVRMLLIWAMLLLILLFFFRYLIAKTLFRAPGDLIYNR